MDKKLSSLDRFKSNMTILLEIISEMFQEGYDNNVVGENFGLFSVIKILITNSSSEKMINNFIKKTHLHWDKLNEKDLEYFKTIGLDLFNVVQNKGINHFEESEGIGFLDQIKSTHLESFKTILESSYKLDGEDVEIFDDEKRDDVWKIIHSFVRISIVYIHEKRDFKEGKYSNEFYPEIKIKENIQKWNIKSISF